MAEETKQRIIQEFVPGKQVTLAHVIANPVPSLYEKMGLIDARGAIGIFTLRRVRVLSSQQMWQLKRQM